MYTEVREHGVGYYTFSTDEKERHRQQAELKKLREQTKSTQISVQKLKEKRASQMAARLKAVKRRKKEKLGLPIDSSSGNLGDQIMTVNSLLDVLPFTPIPILFHFRRRSAATKGPIPRGGRRYGCRTSI